MASREPSWDHYRTLLAVLSEGSLSGAARALGLAQPTIGRHIEALEADLGQALFTRSPQGLVPTDIALELRPYAEALAGTAAALVRAATSDSTRIAGTVRITASEIVGGEVLPPILAGLRRHHPDLVIELALANTAEDLLRREADIAVRMFEPSQDALVARRIGTIRIGLHARRDYLDRRGTPVTFADLAGHDLIGFDTETPAIRSMAARLPAFSRDLFALRTDSDLAQLAALRAGFGIGGCQTILAARDPNLVRILPDAFELTLPVWIVMHENLRQSPRCRAVFDGLVEGLGMYVRGAD